MEITIGSKIYLNREFIKKFETDPKVSTSFQVSAMTDVAVGLRNVRTGRGYTLSLDAVAKNMTPAPLGGGMPRGRVVASVATEPITPPVVDPVVPPVDPIEPDTFLYNVPMPTGKLKTKGNAITLIEAENDPFGNLYG